MSWRLNIQISLHTTSKNSKNIVTHLVLQVFFGPSKGVESVSHTRRTWMNPLGFSWDGGEKWWFSSHGIKSVNFVDGQNPAPVDMVKIPLITRFYASMVVQDFFHQQYHPKTNPRSLLRSSLGHTKTHEKWHSLQTKTARLSYPNVTSKNWFYEASGHGWTTYQSNYNSPRKDIKGKKHTVFTMFFVLHVEGIFLRKTSTVHHETFFQGLFRLAETVEQRKKPSDTFHEILVLS